MTEYIEREAAIRDICEWATNLNNPKMLVREDAIGILENIPAADVRPVVRGKWITHPQETWIGVDVNNKEVQPRQFFAYECQFCGFTIGESGKNFNFCPNCGAMMEES